MKARLLLLVLAGLSYCDRSCEAAEFDKTHIEQLPEMRGLIIQLGANVETTQRIGQSTDVLLHVLDPLRSRVQEQRERLEDERPHASVIVEHWNQPTLPHAENLANFVIVEAGNNVEQSEIDRVLAPGGVAFIREGGKYARAKKTRPSDIDEWTHQWHGTDGGLTTEDQRVGVPQGVQWLSGPLFAMAGRKSSTQSLVSSGGLNFCITQNVLENVGLPAEEMQQYLVAMDSYNGLLRWQRRWTGPVVTGNGETNPRMVATNGKLFVTDHEGLKALDPETGKTIAGLRLNPQVDKILVDGERILIQSESEIRTFDTELNQQVWSLEEKKLTGLLIRDRRCFVLSSGRSQDGRFQHEIICLNLYSGKVIWRTNSQPYVEAPRVRINFVADGFVALQAHGSLHMFSSEDGRHLWSKDTEARPGKTYVDERYVGHFYRRGLVWMLAQNSPRESNGQNMWLGLAPLTGEVSRTLKTTGSWPRTETPAKMGCQVLLASDRYIMIPRQATFIDFETGEKLPFKFTRGGCGLGFVPANGLVYSHPHACGCFSEALRGFMGMHSRPIEEIRDTQRATDENRLTTYGRQDVAAVQDSEVDAWPMYRATPARNAHVRTKIGREIEHQWITTIARAADADSTARRSWKLRTGNVITPPTIANGKLFVAEVDGGRVSAIDIASGQTEWNFDAGFRIDSPPTQYNGLCLFGAHDGYVYCLDSSTGRLVWKFRAAPVERRIVAFGSIESAWPVAGSVLIQDGLAFVAAGRAPDADGGIVVHALRPNSGQRVWSAQVDEVSFRGLADYLVGGEGALYLGNQQFETLSGAVSKAPSDSPHLQGGKAGLLESSWTKHDLALRKEIQTWTAAGSSGQLLAFNPDVTAAYNFEAKRVLVHGDENEHVPVPGPRQVTGLAMTDESLVLAGGLDRSDAMRGGFLQVIDLDSGIVRNEQELSAEPVFDGVAIAAGQIFVSTQDGELHCFSSR